MTYTYKDDVVTQWVFRVANLLNPRRVTERQRWTEMLLHDTRDNIPCDYCLTHNGELAYHGYSERKKEESI